MNIHLQAIKNKLSIRQISDAYHKYVQYIHTSQVRTIHTQITSTYNSYTNHKYVQYIQGVSIPLPPPLPQPNWAMVHMKTIYVQNPISIPDYHASFQSYSTIYLLPVLWFMCQGRAHFHEHFLTVFLG